MLGCAAMTARVLWKLSLFTPRVALEGGAGRRVTYCTTTAPDFKTRLFELLRSDAKSH